MNSKEYYMVPVYTMLAEDFVCCDVDYMLLDQIIVSKTKNGYEELGGFNKFVILKSERDESKKLNITNYSQCLYLNEDDIKEENRVEVLTFTNETIGGVNCYRKLNQKFKMEFYQKDRFDYFVKSKNEKIKLLGGLG